MEPGFACLDDRPVRYTPTEAWAFFDGKWNKIHPAEIYHKGRVLSEAEYNAVFGQRPNLPKTAFQND